MAVRLLHESCDILSKSIIEFQIGAKTHEDFKSIEDKIKTVKESLIRIKGRTLGLRTQIQNKSTPNLPACKLSLEKLNETTSSSLINNKTLDLCIYSKTIEDVIFKGHGTPEIKRKIATYLNKLFMQNNELLAMFEEKYELMKKQYELKLQCQNALFEYKDFLKMQEEKRTLQLQENNPNVAEAKEKIQRSIMKINIMKKLITNLISASADKIITDPEFLDVLRRHRDIVNIERIMEMPDNMES